MPPEQSQESENSIKVQETAEQASSPDATNGTSSSDVAAEPEGLTAEMLKDAFKEEWGDPSAEDEETLEADDEAQQEEETDESEEDNSEEASASGEAEQSQTDSQTDDGDDEHRLSDEDFKALPEGARKRIGSLNTKLRKTEKSYQELESRVSQYEDGAKRWAEFNQTISQRGISPQDLQDAAGILTLIQSGDMEGFLKAVGPYVEAAELAVGKRLPQDLKERVEDGYLTEQDAAEIAKSRFAQAKSQRDVQKVTEQQQQTELQQRHQANVQQIVGAVQARENELKSSDPDYARLEPQVRRQIEYAINNGAQPQTAEQAVQMVNHAYEVAKEMAASRPATPKATPRRPSATSAARGQSQPKSFQEAVTQAALDAQQWG